MATKTKKSEALTDPTDRFRIIEEYKIRPWLWDFKHDDYPNNQIKLQSVSEIAGLMSDEMRTISVAAVKDTWTYLLDYFKAILRKSKTGTGEGAENTPTKWEYFKSMLFVIGRPAPSELVCSLPNTVPVVAAEVIATEVDAGFDEDGSIDVGSSRTTTPVSSVPPSPCSSVTVRQEKRKRMRAQEEDRELIASLINQKEKTFEPFVQQTQQIYEALNEVSPTAALSMKRQITSICDHYEEQIINLQQ